MRAAILLTFWMTACVKALKAAEWHLFATNFKKLLLLQSALKYEG